MNKNQIIKGILIVLNYIPRIVTLSALIVLFYAVYHYYDALMDFTDYEVSNYKILTWIVFLLLTFLFIETLKCVTTSYEILFNYIKNRYEAKK